MAELKHLDTQPLPISCQNQVLIRKEWEDIGQLGKMRILKHSSEPPLPTDSELLPSHYFHIITKVRV